MGALLFSYSASEAVAPRDHWRTIVTPSFRIHYHEGLGPLAYEVAQLAEAVLLELEGILGNRATRPIHVVLTDETDGANGFAEILPQNRVTLLCGVPEPFSTLGDYGDFMRLLFIHELAHVVHLDTIGGVPAVVNQVFGKIMAPNLVQPTWFVEGVAVYLESRLTPGGRNQSAFVDMLVREQILADKFPGLDVLSHFTRRFPGANFPWFLGGRFLQFIAQRHGPAAIAAISNDYGGRLLPYGLNLVAQRATGETMVELYEAWKAAETARVRQFVTEIEAAGGPVEGELVPRPSPLVTHPRWSSNDRWVVREDPRDGDLELVFLPQEQRFRTSDGRGSFAPDGRYVATIADTFDYAYGYSDLEVIAGERRTRRTHGARLFEPDVNGAGQIVAVAQNAGRTRLVTLSLDGDDPPRPFGEILPHEQVFGPRWSPDGGAVVASVLEANAERHLFLFEPQGRTRLTDGPVRDIEPAWSPDGRFIYFSGDRGGVHDLYRLELQSRQVERLTRVRTGAFQPAPSPDGRWLYFTLGTYAGWSLHRLALPADSLSTNQLRPRWVPTTTLSWARYEDEPYTPWESLLPRAYLPTVGEDGLGTTLGVRLSGNDALRVHEYALRLAYGTATERLSFGFEYAYAGLPTPLSFSTSLDHTTRPGSFVATNLEQDSLDSIFRFRAGISFPLGRWDTGHYFGLSWGGELRRGALTDPADPFSVAPQASSDSTFSSLVASWQLSQARGFAESISAAAGQSFGASLRWNDPWFGSDVRVVDFAARWHGYFTLPWQHHVLGLRAGLGAAFGDPRGRSVYALGGLPVRNVFTDMVDGITVGGDTIRGYPVAHLRGNNFYLASAEYRLPLLNFGQGYATLPAFLDRLHASVFVDAGQTPQVLDLAQTKVGVGAELRLEVVFGYFLPFLARLGYARGLMEGATHNIFLVLGGTY